MAAATGLLSAPVLFPLVCGLSVYLCGDAIGQHNSSWVYARFLTLYRVVFGDCGAPSAGQERAGLARERGCLGGMWAGAPRDCLVGSHKRWRLR